jgi:glutathione S-transferase
MKLFHDPISANCYKVRLLLAHLGRHCEEVLVSVTGERPAELLELSPTGRVPFLVLDDGRGLPESDAILIHLARGTALLPEDSYERSLALGWLFFEQNLHEPFIATRRFWTAHAKDPSQRAAQLPFWLERGTETLTVMERHLQEHDWFAAARFTIADIALYGYTHVAHEGGFDLAPFGALRAWLDRVAAQPGHVSMS